MRIRLIEGIGLPEYKFLVVNDELVVGRFPHRDLAQKAFGTANVHPTAAGVVYTTRNGIEWDWESITYHVETPREDRPALERLLRTAIPLDHPTP